MTISEVVRGDMGGRAFRVFDVTGMSSGAVTLSAGGFGLQYIEAATFAATKATFSTAMSVGAVALTTKSGTTIVLSGMAVSGDAYMFTVYGW